MPNVLHVYIRRSSVSLAQRSSTRYRPGRQGNEAWGLICYLLSAIHESARGRPRGQSFSNKESPCWRTGRGSSVPSNPSFYLAGCTIHIPSLHLPGPRSEASHDVKFLYLLKVNNLRPIHSELEKYRTQKNS